MHQVLKGSKSLALHEQQVDEVMRSSLSLMALVVQGKCLEPTSSQAWKDGTASGTASANTLLASRYSMPSANVRKLRGKCSQNASRGRGGEEETLDWR